MLKWRYIWFLLILAGCGSGLDETGPYDVPTFPSPPTAEQIEFIRQFPLLNREAKLAPPESPEGTYPFGAVVVVRQPGEQGSFCTATHLAEGYVVTNAHCVPDYRTLGPGRVFLVYYDKEGTKTFTATEDFAYVGDPSADDVAVLKIPAQAAEEWHTAGARVLRTDEWAGDGAYVTEEQSDGTQARVLKTFDVTVWAFDPFSHHPYLENKWRMPGMWFYPKNCVASRRLPTVTGVEAPSVGEVNRVPLHSKRSRENMHLFLDQCDEPPRHGNSGSLIAHARDFTKKLGVYHWGIQPLPEQASRYSWYEYTGNEDRLIIYPSDFRGDFFGVGFSLEGLSLPFPGLKEHADGAYYAQWVRHFQ